MLSEALQSAMLAFTGPDVAVTKYRLVRPSEADLYRRLNARHRDHLIVSGLMKALAVQSNTIDDEHRVAKLQVRGADALTLSLNTDVSTVSFWQSQIDDLRTQKWNRDDRLAEIDLQQTDLHSFLGLAVPIAADTHSWLMVLLDAVQEVAFRVATEIKDIFRMPRPHMLAHDLAPAIRTPSHSAFPSGHATEAFAAAAVLGALFPQSFKLLRQMACRIAVNRGYAGVHFPVDHHAGAILGDLLGRQIVKHMFGIELAHPAAIAAISFAVPVSAPTVPPAPAPAVTLGVSLEDYALTSPILSGKSSRPTSADVANAVSAGGLTGILPWLAGKVLADVGTDAP